jgi:hypothetical protein
MIGMSVTTCRVRRWRLAKMVREQRSRKQKEAQPGDLGGQTDPNAHLTDTELHALTLADREARVRADALVRQVRAGAVQGEAISADELAAFLREHYLAFRAGLAQ